MTQELKNMIKDQNDLRKRVEVLQEEIRKNEYNIHAKIVEILGLGIGHENK